MRSTLHFQLSNSLVQDNLDVEEIDYPRKLAVFFSQ